MVGEIRMNKSIQMMMEVEIVELKALVKDYANEINKRVPVEQRLLDSANGSKPLPNKEDCLKMARILGKENPNQANEQTNIEWLINHVAVLGINLRDEADCVDAATESFIALPDHLQEMINKEEESIDKLELRRNRNG